MLLFSFTLSFRRVSETLAEGPARGWGPGGEGEGLEKFRSLCKEKAPAGGEGRGGRRACLGSPRSWASVAGRGVLDLGAGLCTGSAGACLGAFFEGGGMGVPGPASPSAQCLTPQWLGGLLGALRRPPSPRLCRDLARREPPSLLSRSRSRPPPRPRRSSRTPHPPARPPAAARPRPPPPLGAPRTRARACTHTYAHMHTARRRGCPWRVCARCPPRPPRLARPPPTPSSSSSFTAAAGSGPDPPRRNL